jgi:hypothetical protein
MNVMSSIRADNDPKFSRRFLYMGIAAIGFSLWCLYDGFVKYPREQQRALAWEKDFANKTTEEWIAFAEEQGWSTSLPKQSKTDEEYKFSIVSQYVMAAVSGLVGLYLVSIPLRARGRWIESSEDGVTSSWGQSFKFEDVVGLEKRQWRSKGIAKVTYLDGGRKRRFVIDDYKFDRYKTDEILYELEQRIDPAMITGGPPEPPPETHDGQDALPEEMLASESSDETSSGSA